MIKLATLAATVATLRGRLYLERVVSRMVDFRCRNLEGSIAALRISLKASREHCNELEELARRQRVIVEEARRVLHGGKIGARDETLIEAAQRTVSERDELRQEVSYHHHNGRSL